LIRIDEQPEKATKAQWALSSMYSSSRYRGTQKKDALEDDTLTLFQFVSILLLYAMDVEDIERRLWAPKYDSVDDDEEDEEDEWTQAILMKMIRMRLGMILAIPPVI
jgi:hypothetical protein